MCDVVLDSESSTDDVGDNEERGESDSLRDESGLCDDVVLRDRDLDDVRVEDGLRDVDAVPRSDREELQLSLPESGALAVSDSEFALVADAALGVGLGLLVAPSVAEELSESASECVRETVVVFVAVCVMDGVALEPLDAVKD